MNNRGQVPAPGGDQSALSLLVNAADGHDTARLQRELNSLQQNRSFADALRRGLGNDSNSSGLEEQLLLAQQHPQFANQGLLAQLRDQNILAQLGQQQQLASLLGLGGGNAGGHQDMRSLLAAQMRQQQQHQQQQQHHQQQPYHQQQQHHQQQQQQQQQQFTHADLLALSRSGLSGMSGMSSFLAGQGMPADLESLQRLEELERRQLLLNAQGNTPASSNTHQQSAPDTLPSQHQQPVSQHLSQHQQASRQRKAARRPKAAAQNSRPTETEPEGPPSASMVASRKTAERGVEEAVKETSAAAADVAAGNKDEIEKSPGSVIVPCRARGMPMDHNFKTAYFVIPENVKHGEELICSYFACRNAGIKFRYCSHCKVPVAKRNFRKRHKHGGEIAAGEDSGDEDEPPKEVKKGIPAQITANREEFGEGDAVSSQSADDSENQNNAPDVENSKAIEDAKGLVDMSVGKLEESKKMDDVVSGTNEKKVSPEREQRWLTLLTQRPVTKDGQSMSNWLMKILAVSDLGTPLQAENYFEEEDDDDEETNDENEQAHNDDDGEGEMDRSNVITEPDHVPETSDSVNSGNSGELAAKEEKKQGSGQPVIVKKKRIADLISKSREPEEATKAKSPVGGSFAEWKERKKQKKQSKMEQDTTTTPKETAEKQADQEETGEKYPYGEETAEKEDNKETAKGKEEEDNKETPKGKEEDLS